MMAEAVVSHRPGAGVPPWLFVVLLLMLFRLPQNIAAVFAETMAFLQFEEMQRLELAITGIEDGSSLPLEGLPALPDPTVVKPEEMIAALMEHGADDRHTLERDWLMGGACARFRAAAAGALAAIERARFLEEQHKVLLRRLVRLKKETMIERLERFGDEELLEVIRRETGVLPPAMAKTACVFFLLEFEDSRRARLRTQWGFPDGDPATHNPRSLTDRAGVASPALWRLRIELLLAKPAFLIDLGVAVIPLLGLLTVLLPGVRQRWVEKRFGLRADVAGYREIEEIRTFMAERLGNMTMCCNLLRPGIAFVYPGGDRRPRLAVLGGMFALWRRSPEQARGVLLHETMHVRRGDYLLVGYGSLFERFLHWLVIGFMVVLATHLVVNMVFSVAAVGLDPAHQGQALVRQIGSACWATLSLFLLLLSKIMVPLLAIWALELNADHGAGPELKLSLQLTALTDTRLSRIHRWAGSLTHPPLWLRTWLLRGDDGLRGMVRQLVFPLAYLIGLVLLVLMGICTKMATGGLTREAMVWLLHLGRSAFAERWWIFGAMAVMVLVWPVLANGWERLFGGAGGIDRRLEQGRINAALVLAALAALAWWLGKGTLD